MLSNKILEMQSALIKGTIKTHMPALKSHKTSGLPKWLEPVVIKLQIDGIATTNIWLEFGRGVDQLKGHL